MSENTPLLQEVFTNRDGEETNTQTDLKATPLPKLQLCSLLAIQLGEPISASVIYPFVIQLVRDTGITGNDEAKIGYWAGFIESVFYLSESLCVLQWGRAADRIGRKPVLLFGSLGLAIAITSFGLSKQFWALIISRCFQGAFNGGIGVTNTVLSEITDESNVAQAFAFLPAVWATGQTLGPVIGGVLSHPADHWPNTLGKINFLKSHPYFLPCIVAALVPACTFLFTLIFLKETLHATTSTPSKMTPVSPEDDIAGTIALETGDSANATNTPKPPPIRTLLTRRVLIPVINYAILGFTEQSVVVLFPLVFATSVQYGGLGFSSMIIGGLMSCLGILNGVFSIFALPIIMRKIGIWKLYCISFACFLPLFGAFPLMNFLARRAGYVDHWVWIILALQFCAYMFAYMAFGCIFIYMADAAPASEALGTVYAMGQTSVSAVCIFAPIAVSSLFSFSQQHNVLGGTLVYWIIWGVVVVGLYLAYQLPRELHDREEETLHPPARKVVGRRRNSFLAPRA